MVEKYWDSLVTKYHEDGKLRPTVVFILARRFFRETLFLLTQSAKEKEVIWTFPQGGIRNNEPVIKAGRRECGEELGVPREMLKNPVLLLHVEIYKKVHGKEANDFSHGNIYFYVGFYYSGSGQLVLNKKEVKQYDWSTEREALERLSKNRSKKVPSAIAALRQFA